MTINIEKMRKEMTWETRKFVLQAILALAAAVGAGVAIGNFLVRSPPPPTIIINNLPPSPPADTTPRDVVPTPRNP